MTQEVGKTHASHLIMNVHDAEKPDSGNESRRKSERCFSSSTDRQTRAQTDKQTQIGKQLVSSQSCRKADVLIDRQEGRRTDRQTGRRTDRQRLIDRQEGRRTDRQEGRRTDRQTGRQTDW